MLNALRLQANAPLSNEEISERMSVITGGNLLQRPREQASTGCMRCCPNAVYNACEAPARVPVDA